MTTLDLTLTPIDNPAARERMERAGDVSASLVESLTSDEIRTLCGNVERDAERGADRHAVPTALLFRLLRTALTGPREDEAAIARLQWEIVQGLRTGDINRPPLTAPTTHTGDERTIERGYEDGDQLRREVEHARSAVRGRVGGAW